MQRDYNAFNNPVTRKDKINFMAENPVGKTTEVLIMVSKFWPVLIYVLFGFFIYWLIETIIDKSVAFMVFIYLGFVIFVLCFISNHKWFSRDIEQSVKLWKFAKDNGLRYSRYEFKPSYSGVMFGSSIHERLHNVLRDVTNNKVEIANYIYGKKDKLGLLEQGYVMISLDRNLPHIILDSKINNQSKSGLIGRERMILGKDQQLSLEGDFDKYFTLYAPKGYEKDALYIFTPDLMLLFINESNTFDAEIVDNKLFIYSKSAFDFRDRAILEKIFSIVEIVGNKMVSRAEKYSDERSSYKELDILSWDGARLNITPAVGIVYKLGIFIIWAFCIIAVGIFLLSFIREAMELFEGMGYLLG